MSDTTVSTHVTSTNITLTDGDNLYVYGTAISTKVSSGGVEDVFSGGTASFTAVSNGGEEILSDGGTASGTTVNHGSQVVYSGGTASFTAVSNGYEVVSSGGTTVSTTVSRRGEEIVSRGGMASFTTVSSGTEYVSSGGSAVSTTVSDNGFAEVFSGGTLSFTTVSDGDEYVYSGGSAISTIVSSGGREFLFSSGTAIGTTVSSGGEQVVFHGGTASGATVTTDGEETVESGGTTRATTVNGGSVEFVYSSGTTVSTMVKSGGDELVSSGGTASDTVLSSGGYLVALPGGKQSGTVSSGGEVVSTGVVDVQPDAGVTLYAHVASNIVVGAQGNEYVLPTGTAVSTTVNSAGDEYVYSGGTASDTTVNELGVEDVDSGGSAIDTTLNGLGYEFVFGGTAISTAVSDGGYAEVFTGGTLSFTTVSSGGNEYVQPGGTAVSTTVSSGGDESVIGGGTAISTTVDDDGSEDVEDAGKTSFTTLNNGGTEDVDTSGTAISTTVSSGGQEYVYASGTAISTKVSSGGHDYVFGTASFTAVSFGGTEVAVSGGTAISTTVSSGGQEYANPSGTAISTTVSSGGHDYVFGTASFTTVSFGGTEVVVSGGTAISTTLSSGGHEYVNSSGTASFTTVSFGGTEIVSSAGTASFTMVSSGGTEVVSSGGAAISTTVDLGGTIDVVYLSYTSGGTASVTSSDALTVSVGSRSYTQQLSGGYAGESFQLAKDAGSGTLIIAQEATTTATWLSATTADWNTPSDWSGGVVPNSSTTDVLISQPGVFTVSIGAGESFSVGAVTLAGASSATGALAVTDAGSELTALGEVEVGEAGAGSLLIEDQASAITGASTLALSFDVATQADASGVVTVSGNQSLLSNTGEFVVGDDGLGSLSIEFDGTVITTPGTVVGLAAAVIANQTGAGGSSVNIVGAGSDWQVNGSLIVGGAAQGSLNIAAGATVNVTTLDLASQSDSSGVVSISGNNSSLTTTGTLSVGDAGSGELSILSGANVNIGGDFDIGQTAGGTGDVDIENPGGTVFVGGNLNLGDGAAGVLTVGPNSTLEVDNGGVIAGPHGVENLFSAIDPFFSDGGTANILDSADQTYKAYVESTSFNLSPGISYTLNTPIIYGSSGFALGVNSSDTSGVTLILNADSLSAASNVTFNDALSTLVIGADVLPSIELPASGTGPFTAAANPNLGLPLIGGFAGTIKDFQVGDTIIVDTKVAATFSLSGSLVLVIANTTTLGVLTFDSLANATLAVITPGALVDQAPCFAAGTRIATERGEVAVEDLCVGDLVRTVVGGRLAPVIWVGRREVDCTRHPKPRTVWPVRISAGAFGPGQPHSDVFLSPDHAVYVGEVLIPVKHLINGGTIVQVSVERVTYHHIELAEHDVVLAQGLPAESFLDMRDGTNYANRPGPVRLYPDYAARMWEAFGCARLVVTGAKLTAAQASVARFSGLRNAA